MLKELGHRLSFLRETGLGYLTLDRSAATLSGGEAQRIRLATQLGNKLVGVLYVLDEPTVGLHPRDTERLLRTLLDLRDLGNTVLAVEHDEVMVRAADHVLDVGPGGRLARRPHRRCRHACGDRGQGRHRDRQVAARRDSPTARVPATRRQPRGHVCVGAGCSVHNLQRPRRRRAARRVHGGDRRVGFGQVVAW